VDNKQPIYRKQQRKKITVWLVRSINTLLSSLCLKKMSLE